MSSPRILIVDDNEMMVKTLADILRVKGYEAAGAHSAAAALNLLEASQFDCVFSDIKMPGTNGLDLFREIRRRQPSVPVVLMTAYSTNRLIQEGLDEGVVGVMTKPLDLGLLLRCVAMLRRERSIIIVDDDPDFSQTLGDILRGRHFAVVQVSETASVLPVLSGSDEVVLLDLKLKQENGLDTLRQIRAVYPDLPVVLVTGYRQEMSSTIEDALRLSAFACIYKPLEIDELLQTLSFIQHQEMSRLLGQPPRKIH